MIVYSRNLIERLTSWAEAVPQAIYGEAAARIEELERENKQLRHIMHIQAWYLEQAIGKQQAAIDILNEYGKPDHVGAVESLREIVGDRFDGVDTETLMRRIRDGEDFDDLL